MTYAVKHVFELLYRLKHFFRELFEMKIYLYRNLGGFNFFSIKQEFTNIYFNKLSIQKSYLNEEFISLV